MTTRKLDIFEVLSHVDRHDIEFFVNLTEEQQREFAPVVAQRWLSGMSSELQVILLNEYLNPYTFALQRHKDLLYKLMTVCSTGKHRYSWVKSPQSTSTYPIASRVVSEYYGYSIAKSAEMVQMLSTEAIMSYAEELGYQPPELSKLKKELKDHNNE